MQKGDYRWRIETEIFTEAPAPVPAPMFRFVFEWMRTRTSGNMICAGPWRKRRGSAVRDLNAHRELCGGDDEIGEVAED